MTAPGRWTGRRTTAEAGRAAVAVPCPFCGSAETELFSLFGSSALTSQHYCRACRTVFEQVKWGTPPPVRRNR